MDIVLKLDETQADLLASILRSHRAQIIKGMDKISPVKNWLAFKMLTQDLEKVENAIAQINEPKTVASIALY